MRFLRNSLVVGLCCAALLVTGCNRQSETDKKLAEMQKQLDDAKKELEAKAATDTAAQPAEQAAAAAPSGAQSGRQATAPASGASKSAPASSRYVTTDQAKKAQETYSSDKARAQETYAADKAKAREVVAQQQAVNQQTQAQIESMKSREYVIPAGTEISVRTTGEISTKKESNGSVFECSLQDDLVVDGVVLAEKGADASGVVVNSDPGGRVKGVASIQVALRSVSGVKGNRIRLRTSPFTAEAKSTVKKDALKTGIMSGVGAAIGAIAGGGKGAAIGAGAGAAAGVGTSMATHGEAAVIPAESVLAFRTTAPVTVTIRQ